MSTIDPSTPRLPSRRTGFGTVVETCRAIVSGLAFWASIPLPLVILATLVTDAVTAAPLLVTGLVVLNICCAALGHAHSPDR